jgi:hypothetical protein
LSPRRWYHAEINDEESMSRWKRTSSSDDPCAIAAQVGNVPNTGVASTNCSHRCRS